MFFLKRTFHRTRDETTLFRRIKANLDSAIILAASLLLSASPAYALEEAGAIHRQEAPGSFQLIRKSLPAPIFVDEADDPGVVIAAENLQADLEAVGGKTGSLVKTSAPSNQPQVVVIGTIGQSRLIDDLIEREKLDVSLIDGEWEAFLQTVVEAPFPGVAQALVIAGSDRRGTIFGVYDLSDRAGVSPWAWWADVPVKTAKNLYVAPGARSEKPAVRYRGIFLNDERPALQGWVEKNFGGFNHQFYEKVFELILRLKGNYLWPAMWGKAFYDDDPLNAPLADEMGVVIGTSHHEPLARAHVEWARYGEGPWDYATNDVVLRDFWREGMERRGDHEAIITIGMRGDGDEAMTEDTAIDLLERIVADQRTIIAEATGDHPSKTPQLWALYKEVQDYYDQGMDVPDDVTLLFADDNWGNIRRLPQAGAERPGGYGVYYHFDYVGGPRNYKWLNTTQIERVWEQMNLAWEYGAKEIWIVNVGDLKPMEFPMEFFLDYAWNPGAWPLEKLADYPRIWAKEQFGEEFAAEIANMLSAYTKYNARRKPELLDPDTYSLVNFGESERIQKKFTALKDKADKIRKKLPSRYDDAYMQLVWHPIHASANLNELYAAVAKNRLCVDQERACANKWADEAMALFNRDIELTRVYHEDIAGGKWDHFMDQTHIGYTYWQQPDQNTMPSVSRVSGPIGPAFGVSFDSRRKALSPGGEMPDNPLVFDRNSSSQSVTATIYNRRKTPFDFSISAPSWLRAEPETGRVAGMMDVKFSVDWENAPPGEEIAHVTIEGGRSGDDEGAITFAAAVLNRKAAVENAFIEADGYISFFAKNYSRAIDGETVGWRVIPNLGREDSSISAFPRLGGAIELGENSPRLEYDFYAFTPGEAHVDVHLAPTLDFKDAGGLKYAISIDDQEPVVVNVNQDSSLEAWNQSVADYAHKRSSKHEITTPGAHTLKLWLIDPALVFEKIVIHAGPLPESYLGPPQSRRISEAD